MKILLLEPFFGGSHQRWAEGYKQNSSHEVHILSLPGRHWKWRMHAGAISIAKEFRNDGQNYDLILASDMLDLSTFLSLTRDQTANIPVVAYFHENQLTYPWSPGDADVKLNRDNHYAFINYTTALTADHIFFNSEFHKDSFLEALPHFLNQFPDHKNLDSIQIIETRSNVLHLGLDLFKFDQYSTSSSSGDAVLLWNHRWEYDKNPELFFHTLYKLKQNGIKFKLIVTGQQFSQSPSIFSEAEKKLKQEIIHFGYVKDFEHYAKLLWAADILPVCNKQDFFGGSVVEAIYCNCFPLLPDRLAYPEHIPVEQHPFHFYQTGEGLYSKLEQAIKNIGHIRSKANYQNFVSKYDWSKLADHYDSSFESLIK